MVRLSLGVAVRDVVAAAMAVLGLTEAETRDACCYGRLSLSVVSEVGSSVSSKADAKGRRVARRGLSVFWLVSFIRAKAGA